MNAIFSLGSQRIWQITTVASSHEPTMERYMRNLITIGLLAAVALPTAASAQSAAEIRRDQREVREQRQDLRDAQRYGDHRDVREERRDLREAKRELREDRAGRRDHLRTRYAAPYKNWSYRPVAAGYQLRPAFYGSRYYANDYRRYGARQPGKFQQWIRYGDDLLLVNTRNGRVLQVVRNVYR
jgi:Ni/Co efflux regulator RcnB